MATLTQAMKDMIGEQLSFIATTDADGYPQIGPKGTLRVLDDNHIIYNEHTGKQAWSNVQVNPRVVIATVDHPNFKGFRFEGPVEIHQDDDIYEAAKEYAAGHKLPVPKAAIVVDITKIYLLDAGPHAGDLIEG